MHGILIAVGLTVLMRGTAAGPDTTGVMTRAYVVVPADYVYKQKGKAVREAGSILTIALQKRAAGWRIAAWAWAKN